MGKGLRDIQVAQAACTHAALVAAWTALAVLVALWLGAAADVSVAHADEVDEAGTVETVEVVEEFVEVEEVEVVEESEESEEPEEELSPEEKEAQRKLEEAQGTYDQALSEAAAAQELLAGLFDLQSQLEASFERLAQARATVADAESAVPPLQFERKKAVFKKSVLEAQKEDLEKQRAKAIYHLALADEELSASVYGASLVSVMLGENNITQVEETEYMLARVASAHAVEKEKKDEAIADVQGRIDAATAEIADLDARIAEAKGAITAAEDEVRAAADEGNAVAFSIEKVAAEARQASRDAIVKVEALDGGVEGVSELKESAAGWDLRLDGTREGALARAGEWYDTLDAIAGLENSIAYGTGLEFMLSEDDFVARWGAAIDMFYEAYSAPLKGKGSVMAKNAYKYKVDPRLCAAVSIVESSGGRFCIKPHNAWGWGAADSDPYNLAFAWDSWEAAIEGWHKGMATSQSGLATTPSLSGMGDIYCSTPIWGSKVATYMEQISSYAPSSNAASS